MEGILGSNSFVSHSPVSGGEKSLQLRNRFHKEILLDPVEVLGDLVFLSFLPNR